MKYFAILLALVLIPSVLADTNTFTAGSVTVDYPEYADVGDTVTVSYKIELEGYTIDQISAGIENPDLSLECKGLSLCEKEFTITMEEEPITVQMFIFLEQAISGTPLSSIDTNSEFVFELSPGTTPIINKRFTIVPVEPQVEVVSTTPYLNEEIVDKVNALGIREITKEQYLEEVEKGKDLLVTKNIEFQRKETENGADIISKWTIRIEPKEGVKSAKNVYIFEDVPKDGAETDDEIIGANPKFTVLRRDPLIMWHFEEVNEPIEITYETDKVGITGAATSVTAEEIQKGNIWQIIAPILLIPIIGFLLIYFGKFKKK